MFDIRNNLPLLYDFYIVAKEKKFSSAAEKYMVSQSNLSRSVKMLEEYMNLKLINSSNKGILLTLDGENLFKELDKIFCGLTQFKNDIKQNELGVIGKITIGTTRNIADNKLITYLTEFNKKYPNVEIKIITDSATNLNEYLTQHTIDILIDYLPHINYSRKYDFEVKAISEFKTCFACSKQFYELEGHKIKRLSDLTNYKLIIPGASRRRQMLDEVLQSNNVKLEPKIEMPDSKLMIEFVQENNFIGYFIVDEIKNTGLVQIDFSESMPTNSIGIIYSKNTINHISKRFIELVLENS